MFGLWQLLGIGALACVLSFGGGFWKGHLAGEASVQSKWDDAERERAEAQAEANKLANRAAARYEETREAGRVRTVYVTKEVTRALDSSPDWRDQPLPAGVRDTLAAAARAASEPDRAVPGAGPARPPDERSAGPGIRFGSGWLERLSGAASGAR